MEVELEEEYEDKQKVLREKRELESKLLTAQDQVLPPLRPLAPVGAGQLSVCDLVQGHFLLIGKKRLSSLEGRSEFLKEGGKTSVCVCV